MPNFIVLHQKVCDKSVTKFYTLQYFGAQGGLSALKFTNLGLRAEQGPCIKMATRSVQPFFHSSRQNVVGHARACLSPNNCPLGWGIWAASNACFLSQPESTTQTASRSVQPFLHSSRQSVSTLYNGPPLPLKIAPSHGASGRHTLYNFGAHPSPQVQTASTGSAVFKQLTAACPYIRYNGPPFPPQNCPLPYGMLTTSNRPTWFPGPTKVLNPNDISIGSAVFAQGTAECSYTLQWAAPFPRQNCLLSWGIWTPSNTWFLGHTRVLNPDDISIGAAAFAGLTSLTDRPTDQQTMLLSR